MVYAMSRLRLTRCFNAVLIILLVLTGHSMAIARGHIETIAGRIVICSGSDVVMVYVDAEGQPVGAPQYCPDGVLSLFDASDGFVAPVRDIGQTLSVLSQMARADIRSVRGIDAVARGPPVSV